MSEAKIASSYAGTKTSSTPILYVLDTNVLIHDPTAQSYYKSVTRE